MARMVLGRQRRQIMKILIAIDSFKGSLSSKEAGDAIKSGILRVIPDAEVLISSPFSLVKRKPKALNIPIPPSFVAEPPIPIKKRLQPLW